MLDTKRVVVMILMQDTVSLNDFFEDLYFFQMMFFFLIILLNQVNLPSLKLYKSCHLNLRYRKKNHLNIVLSMLLFLQVNNHRYQTRNICPGCMQ